MEIPKYIAKAFILKEVKDKGTKFIYEETEAIPIDYIENWINEVRNSLRYVEFSIPDYNDTMNKLYEFEIVIHALIYDWRKENESNIND